MPDLPVNAKPPAVRIRQALAFLAGAVVLAFVAAPDPGDFYRTPFTLGVVYLVAAMLGGRRGGHWSTACVLVGWGLGVIVSTQGVLDVGPAPAYLAGAGLGALAAAGLERAGFDTDLLGVAATIALAGVIFGLSADVNLLDQAETYAAAIALVGTANLALALRERSPQQ